jgi:hypothetical protein
MTPWFRRKESGLGWTPASPEGWVATLLFVLVCVGVSDPELVHLDKTGRMVSILALVAGFFAVILATSKRRDRS